MRFTRDVIRSVYVRVSVHIISSVQEYTLTHAHTHRDYYYDNMFYTSHINAPGHLLILGVV